MLSTETGQSIDREMGLASSPGLSRSSADETTIAPFISIVVPVRNEARFIERTLMQLVSQDYDPERFEIIVVDGHSTDGTPERVARLAAEHPNIRYFDNPKRFSSSARNVGIQNARGDVILIVDGHCEIDDRRHLSKLADAFRRSGADCVGRPQPLDVSDASTLQRAIAAARASRLGHHPDSHIYSNAEAFVPAKSVAVAYRRSVFDAVGLFDERFDACEDVELNHRIDRAGLQCFFTPDVAVRYVPRATLSGLFRQLVRYGRGRVRLMRKHPETLSLGCIIPALFVAGVIVGLPASLLAWWLAATYAAVLSAYVLLILCGSAAVAWSHKSLALLPWLPLVCVTIHVASGTGVLIEALRLGRPAGA